MSLISAIISSLFYNMFQLKMSSMILKKKIDIRKTKNLFIIGILIILTAFSVSVFSGFVKSIISWLLVLIAIYFIYEKGFNKTFVTIMVIFATLFVSEIIYSIVLLSLNELFFKTIDPQNEIVYIISNIFIGLIMISLYTINVIKRFFERFMANYENKQFTKLIIAIFVLTFIVANKNFISFSNPEEYGGNLILIFLFCFIVYFLLKEKNLNLILSKKYDQLFNYLENYEKEMSKKSLIVHEFKNQLITIKGFNDGKNKKLDKYLDEIIKENKTGDAKFLKDMENVPKGGLKGLLYYKLAYLSDEGINVTTSISKSVKKGLFDCLETANYKDIMKVIGVIIDNSIEAARESEKKEILLEMFSENDQFNLIISNTYKGIIDITKIYDKDFSTKGKNRGNGLALVNQIISDNNNVKIENKVTENYFIANLSIQLKSTSLK